jgi:hypothetical protein
VIDKKNINSQYKFIAFFNIFNLTILIFYALTFDLHKASILFLITKIIIFTEGFLLFFLFFRKKTIYIFQNISLFIFFTIISFMFLELIHGTLPQLIPKEISNLIKKTEDEENKKVIQYLDKSPYVKFKPRTKIKSTFFRGTKNQFVYDWETDERGYKNYNYLSKKNKFEIVALGDSWTEGMGVSVDDTFTSILTKDSVSAYNFGVQGYAPSQMAGTFKIYSDTVISNYVVITYVRKTYLREKNYLNKKIENFTGGIGRFQKIETNQEIRQKTKYLVSALWVYTTFFRQNIKTRLKSFFSEDKVQFVDKNLKRYQEELISLNNYDFKKTFDPISWDSSLEAFAEIFEISKRQNRKVIFIYTPNRAMVYYKKATNQDLPEKMYVESKKLEIFCKEHDVKFLDLSFPLIDHVNGLKNIDYTELPFLEIDTHMSRKGYEILAQEIKKLLTK